MNNKDNNAHFFVFLSNGIKMAAIEKQERNKLSKRANIDLTPLSQKRTFIILSSSSLI